MICNGWENEGEWVGTSAGGPKQPPPPSGPHGRKGAEGSVGRVAGSRQKRSSPWVAAGDDTPRKRQEHARSRGNCAPLSGVADSLAEGDVNAHQETIRVAHAVRNAGVG